MSRPATLFEHAPPVALELAAPADWPDPPTPAAFHGLVGEIVHTLAPHTEADRATRGRTLRVNA